GEDRKETRAPRFYRQRLVRLVHEDRQGGFLEAGLQDVREGQTGAGHIGLSARQEAAEAHVRSKREAKGSVRSARFPDAGAPRRRVQGTAPLGLLLADLLRGFEREGQRGEGKIRRSKDRLRQDFARLNGPRYP